MSSGEDVYRPAIVVGIGQIGTLLARALITRQRNRETLHVTFANAHLTAPYQASEVGETAQLTVLTLPRIYLEQRGEQSTSSSAVEIRQQFLESGVPDTLRLLNRMMDQAREHDRQLYASEVRPTFHVVGASWEPTGAALFWLIPYLLRTMLRDWPIEINALLLTANIEGRRTELDDALSFVTVAEGDRLPQPVTPARWVATLRDRGYQASTQRLYDRAYLIDKLKSNSSTLQEEASLELLITHVTTLLEALSFSDTTSHLDSLMLDDYQSATRQHYIGVGASALVVPLHPIATLVEDYSIGTLIQTRLLPQPERLHRGRQAAKPLLNEIFSLTANHLLQDATEAVARSQQREFSSDPGNQLTIQLALEVEPEFDLPVVESLRLQGNNPFTRANGAIGVEEALREELRTCDRLEQAIHQQLRDRNREQVGTILKQCERRVGSLLKQGDEGLSLAIEQVRLTERGLRERIAALRQTETALRESDEYQAARTVVVEEERIRFARHLQPAIEARPSLMALTLRLAVLGVLLYQMYFDGMIRGLLLWPFGLLSLYPFTSFGSLWQLDLVLRLLLFLFPLFVLLAGVPWAATQLALGRHRRALARLLPLQLRFLFLRTAIVRLEGIANHLQVQLQRLSGEMATLQREAQRYTSGHARPRPANSSYLEYAVVEPTEVVKPFREKVAQDTLRHYNNELIRSWVPLRAAKGWQTHRPDEILSLLHKQIQPALKKTVTETVDVYLDLHDQAEWARRLWASAVPWLRQHRGPSRWQEAQAVQANFLLIAGGKEARFAREVLKLTHHCHILDWEDRYRIVLLRMECGVASDQLARWEQWSLAFRNLPTLYQEQMTDDPELLAHFSSFVGSNGHVADELDSKVERYRSAVQTIGKLLRQVEDATEGLQDEASALFRQALLHVQGEHLKWKQHPQQVEKFVSQLGEFSRARELLPNSVGSGVRDALEAFDKALETVGIRKFRPKRGWSFEETKHGDAVETVPVYEPHEDKMIVQVLQRGYQRIADESFVMRPAVSIGYFDPSQTANLEDIL